MTEEETKVCEAAAGGVSAELFANLQKLAPPMPISIRDAISDAEFPIAAVPNGYRLVGLKRFVDAYRARPERHLGIDVLDDVPSFIAHVNRHKRPESVIYCSTLRAAPSVTCVFDHDEAVVDGGRPGWRNLRAPHAFPVSDEWKAWSASNGKWFEQSEFAEFIENRVVEVADPSLATERTIEILEKMGGVSLAAPSRLLALSRGLTVHVQSRIQNHQRLESGEVAICYETEHHDETGARLVVPAAFLLLLPLFRGGDLYPVIARLRYRVGQGAKVGWCYQLFRHEEMFDLAIQTEIGRIAANAELPVYAGTPSGGHVAPEDWVNEAGDDC